MQTSKLSLGDLLEIGFRLFLQLALVVVIFALAIWLWPVGLLSTPSAGIALGDILLLVVSVMFLLAGVTSLYFVLVEPFVRGYVELHGRNHTFE
jgi:pheromone shutdown protein TraB